MAWGMTAAVVLVVDWTRIFAALALACVGLLVIVIKRIARK